MRYVFFIPAIVISAMLMIACVKKIDTMTGPTIGKLEIMADESLKYIIEQEEEIFERNYRYADVHIRYLPEAELFKAFMQDSIRAVIVTRKLTQEERDYFMQRKQYPVEYPFATGAIAFVTNRNAKDTAFTYEEMISLWKDGAKGKVFVIENAKSGITTDILYLLNEEALPPHFYALNSKSEVIDYLKAHDNAIGIIDWTDISDSDNPEAKAILKEINLVAIGQPADSVQYGMVKPYQYNLQDHKYPFTRDFYFISNTGMSDVGMGFASFIAGEIGQKIILKAGLLPKYQFERILEIGSSTDVKVIK